MNRITHVEFVMRFLSSGTLAPRWGWRTFDRPPRALLWATILCAFGAPRRSSAKVREGLPAADLLIYWAAPLAEDAAAALSRPAESRSAIL
jgi:hypothetical protein